MNKMEPLNDSNLAQLGLINFDDVVSRYIKENIAYDFDDNGKVIKTNILITKPQRWSEQKAKCTFKNKLDGNHVNLPVITIYRSGGEINNNIVPHWINEELIQVPAGKKRATYFSDYYSDSELVSNLPTSVTLTYDVNVISANKKHNDHLLEQFIHLKSSYWKFDEYPFKASYSSFIDNSESADQSQERIISSSITLDLKGYVRPKLHKKEPTTKREKRVVSSFQLTEIEVEDINNID